MYIPSHFEVTDLAEIHAFIEANGFGQLITDVDGRPFSTHLPVMFGSDKDRLICHLAKANPQSQSLHGKQILVTLEGPHDYISPSWYHSPGVPTWNYQAVHIYGVCEVFTDMIRLDAVVRALTQKYEAKQKDPWKPEFNPARLGAIVGVEISIQEIQCKYKLSQNRPDEDRIEVIQRLEERGAINLAQAMRNV